MTAPHWDPSPGDGERIREHLDRQKGLPADRLRLDDGRVVPVGEDPDGDDCSPIGGDE